MVECSMAGVYNEDSVARRRAACGYLYYDATGWDCWVRTALRLWGYAMTRPGLVARLPDAGIGPCRLSTCWHAASAKTTPS